MRTGENIRLRKDGRYEARYIKSRDDNGKISYGYCYGRSYEEAEEKRNSFLHKEKPVKGLNLLILGSGIHGQEVKELALSLRIFQKISFLDDIHPERAIGPCRNFEQYLNEYSVAFPAIGDAKVRKRWTQELTQAGFAIPMLIHPSAVVSSSAIIGNGTVICAHATVGSGAVIGEGCIIDNGATVNRGVVVGDWDEVECGEISNLRIRNTIRGETENG